MAQYLSEQWFEAMQSAAASHVVAESVEGVVSLRETITGTPFGDVSYVMKIDSGKPSFTVNDDDPADVTFTQAYATAVALHRSEMTTQEAFFAGKVRVSGHLNTLLNNADLLHGISAAFEDVRANTTYA